MTLLPNDCHNHTGNTTLVPLDAAPSAAGPRGVSRVVAARVRASGGVRACGVPDLSVGAHRVAACSPAGTVCGPGSTSVGYLGRASSLMSVRSVSRTRGLGAWRRLLQVERLIEGSAH